MRIRSIIGLLIIPALASCQPNNPASFDIDYPSMIEQEFAGDVAYNTTAYVEKFWRVVGNAGFDSSIYEVVRRLEEAGYIEENKAESDHRLTYRIEKRALENPTWEPVDAWLKIEGDQEPLLMFATNRNMIAQRSYSTPDEGITAEVFYMQDASDLTRKNVNGKIVFAETHPFRIYQKAIKSGAIGIITYNNPDYLQPEKNTTSIQFRSIPHDPGNKSWGIALSFEARERLKAKMQQGTTRVEVKIETRIYESEELTIVAEARGSDKPNERLVFSAHVQEPGANDNASGVGVATEMAAVTAKLVTNGSFSPKRTLTFLWGDEIVSTRRYVQEDDVRARNIKWGISLDMVGENTDITGGSFLIEKMPDPSAIWTRGKDEHTEWGGSEMSLEDMTPHYLNDFVTNRFLEQGQRANWKVKTNPFEGGSDHVPFLRAGIPSVLFWHFTDQFYHTDNDRIDKVSKSTLTNVGTAALVSAFTLLNAGDNTAKGIIDELRSAAEMRLREELDQGKLALDAGESKDIQIAVINAWEDWYLKALDTCSDMVDDAATISEAILKAQTSVKSVAAEVREQL